VPLLLGIDEHEYKELKAASEALAEVLFIEEKFDIVVENAFELEVEMLRSAQKFLMFADTDNAREQLILNRRFVNLLTACRLYFDHTERHLSALFGKDSVEFEDIRKRRSEEYDRHFGFRFMEALRNFVQHRGYPIAELLDSIGLANSTEQDANIPPDEAPPGRCNVAPIVLAKELKKDGSFKRNILKEVEAMKPAAVNLKSVTREYVEGIWRIHEVTRSHLEGKVPVWNEALENAARRIEGACGLTVEGRQVAVACDDEGLSTESIDIPGDASEQRNRFREKNQFHGRVGEFSRTFVTSEAVMMYVEDTDLMYLDLILKDAHLVT
jgi:hypothetical protein